MPNCAFTGCIETAKMPIKGYVSILTNRKYTNTMNGITFNLVILNPGPKLNLNKHCMGD